MATVTLLVPTFPKLSETFIANKFAGLVDRGLDVHVVAQTIDRAAWSQFQALNGRGDLLSRVHAWEGGWLGGVVLMGKSILLHVMGQRYHGFLRYILKGFSAQGPRVLGNICQDFLVISTVPDVIHFEFGSLAAGRSDLAALLGAKMSASFRGYDLNYVGLDDPHYYAQIWSNLDAAHFLGQDLYQRALRRGCPPSLPHSLIPPSIDTEFFSPSGGGRSPSRSTPVVTGSAQRIEKIRLLSVGRLEWKKGYEYALSAVRLLIDRGHPLTYRIIGAGEYSEAIHFAIRQLGLQDAVEVSGPAPAERVREAMNEADIFVHAAVSEGFCNAVVEAQAMELPVVTSDADGLAENVAHGVTGLVVPRRDPESMAGAMERLIADPACRLRMGKAGRARVLERFRLEEQIEAFHRYYLAMAGEESHS